MIFFPSSLFLITTVLFAGLNNADLPQTGSLVTFLPFDEANGVNDVAHGRKATMIGEPVARRDMAGPFGVPGTSHGVTKPSSIAEYDGIATSEEFTMSLYYYYTDVNKLGGIAMIDLQFSIGYIENNILEATSWGYHSIVPIIGVVKPGKWQFLAFTYNNKTKTLNLYNEAGDLKFTTPFEVYRPIYPVERSQLFVGLHDHPNYPNILMKTGDAISCFMFYEKILTPQEIAQLPAVCQASLKTTTPGPTTPAPTTPKPGPWIRPQALIAFFPLDKVNGLSDMAHLKQPDKTLDPQLRTDISGPFSGTETSYGTSKENSTIAEYNDITASSTLTVSFYYYYTKVEGMAGIVRFDTLPALSIGYGGDNTIHATSWSDPPAKFSGVLKPNSWNFVALTYEEKAQALTIYDETGAVKGSLPFTCYIPDNSMVKTMFLGLHSNQFMDLFEIPMRKTDAIACLAVYDQVFTPGEIAKLPDLCKGHTGLSTIPTRPMSTTSTLPPETTTPAPTTPKPGPWIRPKALIAFFPLDNANGLRDMAHLKAPDQVIDPQLRTDISGPFSGTGTSYGTSKENSSIAEYNDITASPTMTVSFYYYYTNVEGMAGIVRFDTLPAFSIGYGGGNTIHATSWSDTPATFLDVLKPKTWNFVALTYEHKAKMLKLYDETGAVKGSSPFTCHIPDNFMVKAMFLGLHTHALMGMFDIPMRKTDAIACLAVYDQVFTPGEIAKLPGLCKDHTGLTTIPTRPPTTTTTTTLPTTKSTKSTTSHSTRSTRPPSTTTPYSRNQYWPRPSALVGFWPLSSQNGLTDIGPHGHKFSNTPPKVTFVTGPFGDEETAAKPSQSGAEILRVGDAGSSVSFTISVFLSFTSKQTSGTIFQFADPESKGFQFRYVAEDSALEVLADNQVVGKHVMVQPKGAWTFVAFTFHADLEELTVYSRHGTFAPGTRQSQVAVSKPYNTDGFKLGKGLTNMAASCLMIYSEALSPSEIRHVFDACRVIHGSAPCGAPKLPLSAIPSTSKTLIPKNGQFPFMASLRYQFNHICSASIIDEFWLLTSASCFSQSQDPSKYEIFVGEYDLASMESETKIYPCSKIFISPPGKTARDLALIQVAQPIDFASDYVTDICLNYRDSTLSDARFLAGWGENGRPTVISQTLPRCVPGQEVPKDQCSKAWGSSFSSSGDICFMSSSSDKNVPCKGDEGAPLLALPNEAAGIGDRLIQVGIYYKRDSQCNGTIPSLFSSLDVHMSWITQKLACTVPGVSYPDNCNQN